LPQPLPRPPTECALTSYARRTIQSSAPGARGSSCSHPSGGWCLRSRTAKPFIYCAASHQPADRPPTAQRPKTDRISRGNQDFCGVANATARFRAVFYDSHRAQAEDVRYGHHPKQRQFISLCARVQHRRNYRQPRLSLVGHRPVIRAGRRSLASPPEQRRFVMNRFLKNRSFPYVSSTLAATVISIAEAILSCRW
jgi:hypothetical protein